MTRPIVEDAAYLDALFTAIRAFTQELEAAKRALGAADRTANWPWRLAFLAEARRAIERAPARLGAVTDRLAQLGSLDALPPPLDRIHHNLTKMRSELEALAERLEAAEANVDPRGMA